MMTNAIVPTEKDRAIEGVRVLAAIVRELRESVFVEGSDYGRIPGASDKPVLLLPGMEKLMRALRLRAEYIERARIVDFDKPLFFFEYECRLSEVDSGMVMATAIGSANSRESKWRWRDAKRVCPRCGMATINKSKNKPEWYCWQKLGGCGATFAENDPAVVEQTTGRVENPDIADQLNTICKIAQKRALASAIKGAANVSEFFTVDLEDLPPSDATKPLPPDAVEGEFTEVSNEQTAAEKRRDEKPWKDEYGAFIKHWYAQGLTDHDLKAALGIRGRWGEWIKGRKAADQAVNAYIERQRHAENAAVENGQGDLRTEDLEAIFPREDDWHEYVVNRLTLQPVGKKNSGKFSYVLHTNVDDVKIVLYSADAFRTFGFSEDEIAVWKREGQAALDPALLIPARLVNDRWEVRAEGIQAFADIPF